MLDKIEKDENLQFYITVSFIYYECQYKNSRCVTETSIDIKEVKTSIK